MNEIIVHNQRELDDIPDDFSGNIKIQMGDYYLIIKENNFMNAEELSMLKVLADIWASGESKPALSIEKVKGKRPDTIITNVYYKGYKIGSATCNEQEYDEREGVLNAIANSVFENFDREYDKYKKYTKKQYQISCKCSACGKVYDTPEQARECEAQHIKNKKERRERYRIRAEAKRRLAAEEYEKKVKDMMNKISEEENTN